MSICICTCNDFEIISKHFSDFIIQIKCDEHKINSRLQKKLEQIDKPEILENYLHKCFRKTFLRYGIDICQRIIELRDHLVNSTKSVESAETLYKSIYDTRFAHTDGVDGADGIDDETKDSPQKDSDIVLPTHTPHTLRVLRKRSEKNLKDLSDSESSENDDDNDEHRDHDHDQNDHRKKYRSTYPQNKARDNVTKAACNTCFAESAIKAVRMHNDINNDTNNDNNPGCIIYLDGAYAFTTKELIKRGVPTGTPLIIPNVPDYEELNETVKSLQDDANASASASASANVSVKNSWLGDYINAMDSKTILSAIWADYTCTLMGDKTRAKKLGISIPFEDIKFLFNKGVLRTGSIFAITLSTREGKTILHKGAAKKDAMLFLERTSSEAGLRLKFEDFKEYGQMFFLLYTCEVSTPKVLVVPTTSPTKLMMPEVSEALEVQMKKFCDSFKVDGSKKRKFNNNNCEIYKAYRSKKTKRTKHDNVTNVTDVTNVTNVINSKLKPIHLDLNNKMKRKEKIKLSEFLLRMSKGLLVDVATVRSATFKTPPKREKRNNALPLRRSNRNRSQYFVRG